VAKWLTTPALIFGSNAITAYALSMLLPEILFRIPLHDGARVSNVWGYIYEHLYARGHSTELTSLAFAISVVVVCFLCDWLLYRKGIFIKI
jgi:predicted acyltransferase